MAKITQRISAFRGINRSARQNRLDISYAYNAANVDIIGGKLTNKIGSYRLVSRVDVPAANPIIYFTNDQDYMILRDKYFALGHGTEPGGTIQQGTGPYEPVEQRTLNNVQNVSGRYIRGVGRSYVRANIDFFPNDPYTSMIDKNCVVVSGMLGEITTLNGTNNYWTYRDFLVDGASAKTAMYYLGYPAGGSSPVICCKQFGSGQYLAKNIEITEVGADANGKVAYIKVANWYDHGEPPEDQFYRAIVDGIYLFSEELGNNLTDEDINNAYMWLKVTDIEETVADYGDTITITVDSDRQASEITVGTYAFIRGGCSDFTVTYMQMYYGRLFAAAHRSNTDFPRRLFWSRLPGDGRTIEDWTADDVSTDTSGGHVDIGDPSDGYITGLVVCGTQMLIFTQTRLWRLYGTSPSNYRVELVGKLEGTRVSNPIEVNGMVYWLSLAGICYYNGSYIVTADDDYNTRYILNDLPEEIKDSMYYSTVHATLFDNSIMFAFDPGITNFVADPPVFPQEAVVLRYELETGNVIRYVIPCNNFLQQFTDSLSQNFGVVNGNTVEYETRYFQALVHSDHTMTMTQWHDWGRQEHGWYDNQEVESLWETDWDDLGMPETAKKVQTVLFRGSGEFDFTIESEASKDKVHVNMPGSRGRVKDITPKYAEGRSMKFAISGNKLFEIEPYMTMLFDNGDKR